MTDGRKRLVEAAFPVEQVSLDSVHEKNVRHGERRQGPRAGVAPRAVRRPAGKA